MQSLVVIATRSHLASATVALNSVSRKEIGRRYLYTIGAVNFQASFDQLNVEVRRVEDRIESSILNELASRYTRSELCFALKPYVMQDILNEGGNAVHYIDSDIKFFGGITPLVDALSCTDLLLTPHYLYDFPNDQYTPSALTLLRGGVFNAGYVGVSNNAEGRRFLGWWAGHVSMNGFNAPHLGMCGDQRWLDLVPVLFPGMGIFRHAGANVAYWNLHERSLTLKNSLYMTLGSKLLFFHFSGFNPEHPLRLSVHQNRISVSEGSVLCRLLYDYAREVKDAGWAGSASSVPQGEAYGDTKWPIWLRRLRRG